MRPQCGGDWLPNVGYSLVSVVPCHRKVVSAWYLRLLQLLCFGGNRGVKAQLSCGGVFFFLRHRKCSYQIVLLQKKKRSSLIFSFTNTKKIFFIPVLKSYLRLNQLLYLAWYTWQGLKNYRWKNNLSGTASNLDVFFWSLWCHVL